MKKTGIILSGIGALTLAACTTAPGPVEVTRFVAPERMALLGEGSITVQSGVGDGQESLALQPYETAVAAELASLGYTAGARGASDQIATVTVKRYVITREGRRSPVSVGGGGRTGSYGSGVGLGVGINLGGGQRDQVGSELSVTIRDAESGDVFWEGRADFRVDDNSPLAQSEANAQTLAAALFSDFPGNNGQTIEVEVPK